MIVPFGRTAASCLALLCAAGIALEQASASRAKNAPLPPARPVLSHEIVPLPPSRPTAKGALAPIPELAPLPRLAPKSEAAPVVALASLPRDSRPQRRMFRPADDILAAATRFTTVQAEPLAGVRLAALQANAALTAATVGADPAERRQADNASGIPLPPHPLLAGIPLPPEHPGLARSSANMKSAPPPPPAASDGGRMLAPHMAPKSDLAPAFTLAGLPRGDRPARRMFRAEDDIMALPPGLAAVQADPLAGLDPAALPGSASNSVTTAALSRAASADSDAPTNRSGIPLPPEHPRFASLSGASGAAPLPPRRPAHLIAPVPPRPPVAPAPATLLSKQDFGNLKQAFAAVDKEDFATARSVAQRIASDTARSLVEWRIVHRAPIDIGYDRIARFLAENPFWPKHDKLVRRAEEALFEQRGNAKKVLEIFAERDPVSGPGMASLAYALYKTGDKKGAKAWLSRAWRTHWLTDTQEEQILRRFGNLLGEKDHKARFDSLLYRRSYSSATRLTRYVGAEYKKLVSAYAAVEGKRRNAGRLLSRLPDSLRDDPVGMFSRIHWLRREGRYSAAADLMLQAPRKRSLVVNPGVWWHERHVLAREMIDLKKYDTAYKLASEHCLFGGADYAEAEFLAGWIALRHLDKPKLAEKHFKHLRARVRRPISVSRAEYWLGRAFEAQDKDKLARLHYANASSHSTYFYGQLARLKLGGDVLYYPDLPAPDESLLERFRNHQLVRAAAMLREIDEVGLARSFITALAREQHDPQELHLTATMARELGMPALGHRVGKIANIKGYQLVDFAYMTDALPDFQRRGHEVEDALIHALVRQESAFNSGAVSHAGAQGLMQLMPPTARAVAKQHGAPYSKSRLLTDPAYNAMLGTAHLGDLIYTWSGSYIMAVAAYNAGEYRLKQWIDRYGDPRDPKVDPIDWIESIPFSETRDYVHRVLENLQVYRARLNDNLDSLRIASDLARGRAPQ